MESQENEDIIQAHLATLPYFLSDFEVSLEIAYTSKGNISNFLSTYSCAQTDIYNILTIDSHHGPNASYLIPVEYLILLIPCRYALVI